MKRGEIWTVATGAGYAGKPRPVLIVQNDRFDGTASVTICAFTTDPTEAPLFRIRVEPTDENGLRQPCSLMVDKLITVPRGKIRTRTGRLARGDMVRLNRALAVFLGLASSSTS